MSVDCSATILYGWDITELYKDHKDFFEQFEDNIYYQSDYDVHSPIFLGVACCGAAESVEISHCLHNEISEDEKEILNTIQAKYIKETQSTLGWPKFYLVCRWW